MYHRVHQFLIKLNRDYIKPNDRTNGIKYLSHLHEPNEYHLGYSNTNHGKAVSIPRAELIYDALRSNNLAKQASNVTNEAHFVLLLVKGIGQDIMSDIIANVCRDIFANFTNMICSKYGVKTHSVPIEFYNSSSGKWEEKSVQLPLYMDKTIILLPANIICGSRMYSGLYNRFVAKNYIAVDILNGKTDKIIEEKTIKKLKNGTRKVILKRIYALYKKPKEKLIDFVKQYKGSLDEFVRYAKKYYPELNLDDFIE